LKLIAARPDAVLVGASGTGAALPQIALRERGYTGPIYQTHGAATKDFVRIAGKSAEGTILASGPAIVPSMVQDPNIKREAENYVKLYEGKYGKDSATQFGAHAYDSFKILERVIPVALKSGAKPGTKEFREALLKALESEKEIAASQGIYNFTPTDHAGLDDRARVLLSVKNGDWAPAP
jgi:branched-chain amino acid transport system substrate-binding protein